MCLFYCPGRKGMQTEVQSKNNLCIFLSQNEVSEVLLVSFVGNISGVSQNDTWQVSSTHQNKSMLAETTSNCYRKVEVLAKSRQIWKESSADIMLPLGLLILFMSLAQLPCVAVDGLSDAYIIQVSMLSVKLLIVFDSEKIV